MTAPQRVLVVHTRYRQPGGEDRVFAQEVALLRGLGLDVEVFEADNAELEGRSAAALAALTVWNGAAAREVAARVARHRSEVVHIHNTFPLLSPSVVAAARRAGAAVVQTWHNYRLGCVNGLLFRDGHPCEDCLGRPVALSGVAHACYRDSRPASLAVAAMQLAHRGLGTYRRGVDRHIALTPTMRLILVRMGLPPEHVTVKPNFIVPPAPPLSPATVPPLDGAPYALFAGRLSEEKGVRVALAAWAHHAPGLPLLVAGGGPLEAEVRAMAARLPDVHVLGQVEHAGVLDLMREAHALVMPSLWQEPFGLTVLEAFSVGLPVVAARLGAPSALVDDGRTGRLVRPNDPADLARALRTSLADPAGWARLREQARQDYLAHYTPETNGVALLAVYRDALARRRGRA